MGPERKHLILFTRYPLPGRVKTRLIPALGPEGAESLHRRLVLRTLRTAHKACRAVGADLEIRFDGRNDDAMRHWLGECGTFTAQGTGDLGERMANAFEESFRPGSTATIIVGSDCPGLTPELITAAFERLSDTPVVLGPANDGGYYLIGLTSPVPELFRGIAWGTETVLADSLRVLERKGLKPFLLMPLDDLDRPEELPEWYRITEAEDGDLSRVSVIIPTLNEERQILATLDSVHQHQPREVIVVDGGSTDATVRLASQRSARVINSKPGRAGQMNAGAAMADGQVLLFLHADTRLPPKWLSVVLDALRRPEVAAGSFRFSISGAFPGKSFVEWTTGLRSKWLQRPYGDQGLFLKCSLFEELGGFADLPIMEDYEFVRRLRRRGRIITAAEPAVTSARRWQRLGVFRTTLLNQLVVAGYHLGVHPQKLAALYQRALFTAAGGERRQQDRLQER